jgi:hypothetical protein
MGALERRWLRSVGNSGIGLASAQALCKGGSLCFYYCASASGGWIRPPEIGILVQIQEPETRRLPPSIPASHRRRISRLLPSKNQISCGGRTIHRTPSGYYPLTIQATSDSTTQIVKVSLHVQ